VMGLLVVALPYSFVVPWMEREATVVPPRTHLARSAEFLCKVA
jgi:hypothetical protein